MSEQNKNLQQNSGGAANKLNIQPSEPENEVSRVENKNGDPGRTPGKAEGSRETVEEDLKQKNERENA